MVRNLVSTLAFALFLISFSFAVHAQESDVRKYAVDVNLDPLANAATVRTTLTLVNLADTPKSRVQLRINGQSEVRSVTVGGQQVSFDVAEDRRNTGIKVVTLRLPSAIPSRGAADITVESRLVVATSAYDASITPGATVLLPTSLWLPVVNSQFVAYGINTAPFTLTATAPTGERAVSGGELSGSTFTQSLYSMPFVITGDFGAPLVEAAGPVSIETWLPANSSPEAQAGARRIVADAKSVLDYYTRVLGPAPKSTFRIVASDRGAGYSGPSVVVLGDRVFTRDMTDAETIELLADALARIWTEGTAPIRGAAPGAANAQQQGVAILRDALPRYLAIRYIGERYGEAAERQSFDRLRVGLLRMGDLAAQVQLGLATPTDPSYRGLISTKGPLALRIAERQVGRDAMLAAVKQAVAAARTSGAFTLADLRASLSKSGTNLDSFFKNWIDEVVLPDLIVGIPQQNGSTWTSALRNLGTGDVEFDVVATTESGKKITSRARVPSNGFGQVTFDTTERIVSVRVDPDHVVPQTNYANDVQPASPDADASFVEGVEMVKRKQFADAENRLRTALEASEGNPIYEAWLARALLGLGKTAEAQKFATAAIGAEPPPLDALTWGHNVLGQIALSAGDAALASTHFEKAIESAVETSALRTARDGAIAALRAGNQTVPIDAGIQKFFAEFDRAVSAGVNTEQAKQYVDAASMPDFLRGLVVNISRKWSTEILRTQTVGENEAVADVKFVVSGSADNSTARVVARLRRFGTQWKLVDIQVLETA